MQCRHQLRVSYLTLQGQGSTAIVRHPPAVSVCAAGIVLAACLLSNSTGAAALSPGDILTIRSSKGGQPLLTVRPIMPRGPPQGAFAFGPGHHGVNACARARQCQTTRRLSMLFLTTLSTLSGLHYSWACKPYTGTPRTIAVRNM